MMYVKGKGPISGNFLAAELDHWYTLGAEVR